MIIGEKVSSVPKICIQSLGTRTYLFINAIAEIPKEASKSHSNNLNQDTYIEAVYSNDDNKTHDKKLAIANINADIIKIFFLGYRRKRLAILAPNIFMLNNNIDKVADITGLSFEKLANAKSIRPDIITLLWK